ncbi:MAG: LacI family DNA-binding transcriptional regulator [Chloroherpetonaceae bacterium]|nr:LacI family transcriptional regulator [Chthonomonadaceae bacterium]MDW8209376.1 LacI family DNA-binding transcriptional regulator [Chloroherpetonaceae bacterium]
MTSLPLYQRVKQQIEVDYLLGSMGDRSTRLPSERDLQQQYRVSRPTISKALTALAAEGKLLKMQGSGNYVIQSGSFRPHGSSRSIGFIGPISGAVLVQSAFRGIDRVAHRRGYCVLMGNAGNNVQREEQTARQLLASGAQGLIIYPVARTDEEHRYDYLIYKQFDVPVILIDVCTPEQGHTQVIFDNRRLGYAMTEWLIQQGHRRIGILFQSENTRHGPLINRMRGYREALAHHNIPFVPALVCQTTSIRQDAPFEQVDRWLSMPDPPTAILATDDLRAAALIEYLQARGVRVPQDICVTGFDNREETRRFWPLIATSQPDFEHMGEIACHALLDRIIEPGTPHCTYVLDAPLLIRDHYRELMQNTVTGQGVSPDQQLIAT